MGRRQRVFFRIGAWACIATGAIHLAAQFAPRPGPHSPAEELLFKLLKDVRKDYGAGFHRSMSDFLAGFNLCFSLFLVWIGVLCLAAARRRGEDAALMRAISTICAVFAAVLLGISVAYFFLPPTVCLTVVFLGFAGAALSPALDPGA